MGLRNFQRRLKRLQAVLMPARPQLSIVGVDDDGRVLDDGTEASRPWVGRNCGELPRGVQILRGVDPLEILGRSPSVPTREEP
jgi:hypothetical protein